MARIRRRGTHAAGQRAPLTEPPAQGPRPTANGAAGIPPGGTNPAEIQSAEIQSAGIPSAGPSAVEGPLSGPPAALPGPPAALTVPPARTSAAPSPSAWPFTPGAAASGSEPPPTRTPAPASPSAWPAPTAPEVRVASSPSAWPSTPTSGSPPTGAPPSEFPPSEFPPSEFPPSEFPPWGAPPSEFPAPPVWPGMGKVAAETLTADDDPLVQAARWAPLDVPLPPSAPLDVPLPPSAPLDVLLPASAPLDVPLPPSAPLDVQLPTSAPLDILLPPSAPLGMPVPPSAPPEVLVPPSAPLSAPRAKGVVGRPAMPGSGLRASITQKRTVTAVCAVAVLALLLVSARSPDPSVEPTVQQFLLAWEQGQYRTAASLTTGDPAVVTTELRTAYQQLDAADITLSMGHITQHGDTGEAQFNASIDLGRSGAPWQYQGRFALHRIGSTWKVLWRSSVINPGLRPGFRLAVVTTVPKRAELLDASGSPLTRRSEVVVAGVRPGRLTDPVRTADRLANATHLAANEIYGQILAAPSASFFELVRFQPSVYHRLRHKLSRVPGLIVKWTRMRLFESAASSVAGSVGTETARVLRIDGVPYRPGTTVGLSGLQQAYQRFLVGTPTTEVVAEDAKGRQVSVLKRWPGSPGKPVRTTIDAATQAAADDALQSLPGSAAIVAVRASDGKILAVGTRNAHGMPAVSALDGRYRPGQAFTIVSTAALVAAGFNVDTPIPCKVKIQVGGRTFTNSPQESGLGTQPPFGTDFARACGTAFAGLSLRLHPSQLTSTAAKFGLGAGWQLPLRAFAGSLASGPDDAELAADSIGAGTVLTSPLDMALVAAVVQSGTWHRPSLVTSPSDPGLVPRVPFGPQVVGALRSLMRRTVVSGAGRAADVGGAALYGQVGNVSLGPGHHGLRASWFVGYRGDVAFAVLELTRSSWTSAAPVAGKFLRELSAGS